MKDIHGLKPLMPVDFPWLPFVASLLLMIGVLLLGAWQLWRLLRRRQPVSAPLAKSEMIHVDPQQVRQTALEALAALETSQWLAQGQAQPFYLALEGIFKRYVEGLCHHPVTSLTDRELQAFLRQQGSTLATSQALEQFLARSLQGRFARQPFSQSQMRADLKWLREYVKQGVL